MRERASVRRRDLSAQRAEELVGIAAGRLCPDCRRPVDEPGFVRGWEPCLHDIHSQAERQ